uniref:Rap guanine nucleotide exchange factor like 1 n=1 Tax=Pelusios castaneus TaxID=367368 RepID=A0A8C8SAF5_9SAUR
MVSGGTHEITPKIFMPMRLHSFSLQPSILPAMAYASCCPGSGPDLPPLGCRVSEETQPSSKVVKPLFRHFRRIDSCLQTRVAFRGSDEIFCRVYMPDHSYVTIRSRLSASVQDILAAVTEKLQYSEEQGTREEALILVVVTSSGEKAVLQPSEECVFTTLGINSHLFACTKETIESLVPLPEEIQVSPGDTEIHRVEAEEIANHLTTFHWELFRCIHELEFVDYVFHGERGRRETANLELLLQRCSEVQHWVATEILLCESPGKRAHLLKKFIKIAAICKQSQDMLSFYTVVMGLDNAAVSRLRLTWEKLPGKFKNLFRKFETLTDPCRNHKAYRDALSKMKPPLIPFVPLILKDLTFLHEGSKMLLDGLVNVEKLHSIAEKVRTIRKYRSRPLCEYEASPQQFPCHGHSIPRWQTPGSGTGSRVAALAFSFTGLKMAWPGSKWKLPPSCGQRPCSCALGQCESSPTLPVGLSGTASWKASPQCSWQPMSSQEPDLLVAEQRLLLLAPG